MKRLILLFGILWSCCVWAAEQSDINSYVQDAPTIRDHSDLGKVVKYITKKYKKDEEIGRAALAWIVYNIDYDDYYFRQADKNNHSRRDLSDKIPEQGDIIKTRLGVCKDIAVLYSEMLDMAGIQSRTVSGCHAPPNNKGMCRANPHMWNVVWIKKRWELVDPTFAMGEARALQDVSNQYGYKRMVRKREKRTSDVYKPRTSRKVDTAWFMTDPHTMAEDHQPDDKRWYLLKASDRKKKD